MYVCTTRFPITRVLVINELCRLCRRWITASVTTMDKTFTGAHVINVDLGNWGGNLGKVLSMRYMFKNADKFEGNRLDKWIVSTVAAMSQMFDGAGLTSCNKRRIADAWGSLPATKYVAKWTDDTCLDTVRAWASLSWCVCDSTWMNVCSERIIAVARFYPSVR